MITTQKTILSIVLAIGLAVFCVPQLYAQSPDSPNWRGFFDFLPAEKQAETGPASDIETESIPDENGIHEESLVKPLPTPGILRKELVKVTPHQEKEFVDAGDFRDPFLLLRGSEKNAEKVMEPGVTVDGIQFNSYKESDLFIEKVYRDSGFQVEDVFGKAEHLDGGGCLYCHRGIERISKNHKFRCTKCHAGNRRKRTLPAAHRNLVSNPSDLDHAPKYCGKCHADQIEQVEQSPMATAKNMINITRYAWGAQGEGESDYSLRPKEGDGESALSGLSDGKPVDVFLRTKCLRCHLQGESPHRPGDYRAGGCAACHMIYSNDGHTLTHDRAIQSKQRKNLAEKAERFKRKFASKGLENPRAYPVLHKFTTAIPSVQCEHCHNANGIGNEFEGLFSPAARPQPAFQLSGADKPVLYGAEHEFLLPDIHRERGMHCIDCHVATDLKGAPSGPELHAGVEIRCENCHGTPTTKPEELLLIESDPRTQRLLASNALNPNLRKKIVAGDAVLLNSGGVPLSHVKKEKDKWVLYSRVTGKKHVIPLLAEKKPVTAHQIARHMETMECHTCHARWSAGEWGLHVIQEENPDLSKWKDWSFTDPTLQNMLWNSGQESSGMIDWLSAKWVGDKFSGNTAPGVFWNLFVEADWDTMILGKNQRGKYSIMKPRYQYFLTDRQKNEENSEEEFEAPVTEDERPRLILIPHTPHTIRTTVRPCESCHDSEVALGLGDPTRKNIVDSESFLTTWKEGRPVPADFQSRQVVTEAGEPIQKAYPSDQARFLNAEEIAAMKNKGDAYKAYRYMDLREKRFPRLLARDEFPFDRRHKTNEALAGEPGQEKDILFNVDENSFEVRQPIESKYSMEELPAFSVTPPVSQEKLAEQDRISNIEPIEGKMIMEFSPEFFEAPVPDESLDTSEDVSTGESGKNGEGLGTSAKDFDR